VVKIPGGIRRPTLLWHAIPRSDGTTLKLPPEALAPTKKRIGGARGRVLRAVYL
jgi:hypothetical protein